VSKDVLQTISKLECVNVAETVLDVRINNKLGETKNFTAKMESVSEARLLSLLGGQRLDGFQVEVVIQVKVIQILTMNQKIQHIVTLSANLQTSFNPVKFSGLEEFSSFQLSEKVSLVLGLLRSTLQSVENVAFQ
jgi:hypothetical protein